MKQKTKNKTYIKAGGVLSTLIIGIVVGMLAFNSIPQTIIEQTIHERTWKLVPLGDADPGAQVSGVVNISLVKHGLYDYKTNITRNASMFAWSGYGGEANNTEIGINVPYGIKFDIVAKVIWNKTHAWNSTSNNWTLEWVRGNISMPRFNYENYSLDEWNITANTGREKIFVQYVLGSGKADADNGMSINKSERVPQCYFRFWSYF